MAIRTVSATLTRPADTTTYAANDAVSDSTTAATVMTFSNVVEQAGDGATLKTAVIVDSAYTAPGSPGGLACKLFLFHTAPGGQNDNAALALTDAEMDDLVAMVTFDLDSGHAGTPTAGADGNSIHVVDDLDTMFQTAGSRDLYGVVVATNAFVPISAEAFTFKLVVEQ